MVRQEIWGLFLTHYAVRAFMTEAADTIDLDPDRRSPEARGPMVCDLGLCRRRRRQETRKFSANHKVP